jgi:outer membrane protein TolC
MKPLAAVLALGLVTLPADARGQAPATALTLAQAVADALARNDRLVNEQDTVAQAELGVRLARTAFRPQITPNILGSFGQTDVSSQTYRVDLSQRFTTGTEIRLGVGAASAQIPGLPDSGAADIRFYNTDTTLSLSQPLLRGFGRDVARRALTGAEYRRADAARAQALAEQQVALDVAAAYYAVVAQNLAVDVTRVSLDRARALRDASEAKLDAGLVSQLDVLRAQQLVAQAESQYFDAQAASEDARDRLAFLIGRDRNAPFEVEHTVPPVDGGPIDVEAAITLAQERRLDLQSRADDAAEADRRVRFSRNQLLPQVDVNFALTRRETSTALSRSFGLDGYQFATFFTIAMPVDRTTAQVEYQTAVLDRNRRRRDADTLARQVADDVRRSVRARDRAIRNALAAETAVDIGRREVEVAQLRYERGLSNNLDVITAEGGLLSAQMRRIQALAEAALAALRLRTVVGVFDPRTDVAGRPAVDLPREVRRP